MLDQPTEGRGLPQWHRYLNHQKQGRLRASAGKTRLCLSRFQPARHLVCQGQYPPAFWSFLADRSREMMSKVDSVSRELGIHQLLEKYPLRNLWWAKTTGGRSTGHHHLT